MREKDKLTHKGNDKQEVADSLIHNTTCHTQCLFQFFKILGFVVPVKSLTKIYIFITLHWSGENRKRKQKYILASLFCFQ